MFLIDSTIITMLKTKGIFNIYQVGAGCHIDFETIKKKKKTFNVLLINLLIAIPVICSLIVWFTYFSVYIKIL